MGNCSSEHQAKLFRTENFSSDPTAFRVFVKKKNKFIPGWLKINDDEIVFTRGNGGASGSGNNFQFWPLAYLRRYGYTCSGIFFFESGRRCATGEGLHTFQSHQAEKIFQMVQGKIKIEEYARGSRASSVVSNNRTNVLNPTQQSNRIHPVQRFSSEGSTNEYRPTASPSLDSTYSSCPTGAPPPYEAYQRSLQEAMNRRLYAATSPAANYSAIMSGEGTTFRRQRQPSTSSASVHSTGPASGHALANGGNGQQVERPRSVVSALEHGLCGNHFVPSPPNNPPDSSAQVHLQQQRMFESMNAGHPLDRSFMSSSMSSSRMFTASPWASQHQLENEIVLEHVLSKNTRKYYHQQMQDKLPAFGQQYHSSYNHNDTQSYCGAFVPSVISPTSSATAAALRQRKYHSYVNVDLPPPANFGMSTSCYGTGSNGNLLSATKLLAARELHRTNKSRQEFLSSQPGGFVFNNTLSNFNPILTTSISGGDLPPSGFDGGIQRSSSQSAFTALAVDGGVARLRKRVPQLPLSPSYQSSTGQQNYALINFATAPNGAGLTVTDAVKADPPTVFDAGPIPPKGGEIGEAPKSPLPPSDPRTNYALIDFHKTKALESAAHVKIGQPPADQGAFV